ncbi:hypothetical protein B0T20DRAFT_482146 [Sordaria brevicollis]|uniref:Uncharacterized protein n=1 Tax=Sordaria brevicollis TaxID=83679 RepID=A0AAE0U9H9_SORBR|nr:hypothetical protein B0T20DRAFT_482146 [Sordaria brevicollis]
MFSLLTRTFVRIASPIVLPLIRPAIAHAVGYFQPIEAEFDSDFYPNERVTSAISKVRQNVAIAKKHIRAVAELPKAITSQVFGKSIALMTSIIKAPVVVASRVIGMSNEAVIRNDSMGTAGETVERVEEGVKRFVPSFLLSTIRTYRGTSTEETIDLEAQTMERATDDAQVSASGTSPARGTISVYPSPPPLVADPFYAPRGTPPFPCPSQPETPGSGTATAANLSPAPRLLSVGAPLINGSPRSDAISELVLGSPISSLDLGESIDSILAPPITNGFVNGGGNENSVAADTSSHEVSSSSSSVEVDSSSVEVLPANSPVNNDSGLIAAASDISLPSPTCSSDLSEIRLPVYSPGGPDNGQDHNNTNLNSAETFSEDEEDADQGYPAELVEGVVATPLDVDNQGLELDEGAQMGSEEGVQVEDEMEQSSETGNVEEGQDLAREAEQEEVAASTPASSSNTGTQNSAAVSSNPQDVTANTSMPPKQPQQPSEGLISDTETVNPGAEGDHLEPYVFNWEEHAFIDATGHLNVRPNYQGIPDAHRPRLYHDHWIGLTDVDKPKQAITHYPGPVDPSTGQQPSLPVPELTVTIPEGETFWLEDPLPYNRLCMNWKWLSQSYVDEAGRMGLWRDLADEDYREQVARGQSKLQRDNWVLSKFAPLEKRPEGVPEITVTVPRGETFWLDEPRSWADLDDDEEDW